MNLLIAVPLQWGRDLSIAEIRPGFDVQADFGWLQWGRDLSIAEVLCR
jgi:hypothetical protein